MLYRLSVEDVEKLENKVLAEGFKSHDIAYVDGSKALRELMVEYDEKGYLWKGEKKPNEFNPWWTWAMADGYVIGVSDKSIWCFPADKDEFEDYIGHKI